MPALASACTDVTNASPNEPLDSLICQQRLASLALTSVIEALAVSRVVSFFHREAKQHSYDLDTPLSFQQRASFTRQLCKAPGPYTAGG